MGVYVLALMFLLGGLLFTLLGYSNLVSTRKERATWLAVAGTVIDFREESGDRGRTLYAPVYRYLVDGTPYTATSKIAASPPGYSIGDPIQVFVNPSKPGQSDVVAGTGVFSYGMLAMGLLALAVGVLVAWLGFTGQMRFE
jgi:hypothetical protein